MIVADNESLGGLAPADRTREFEEHALVHLDALYRTALRLMRDRAAPEDLVQDTCLRAFDKFHQFEPGTNCRGWMFTILRRTFLNGLRGRGREVLGEDVVLEVAAASATAPATDNPEAEFFRGVLPADVDRALKDVPVVFREAVILVDLEGFSYREAAASLGCPVGTVMSRLSRGRDRLRRSLTPALVDSRPPTAPSRARGATGGDR